MILQPWVVKSLDGLMELIDWFIVTSEVSREVPVRRFIYPISDRNF